MSADVIDLATKRAIAGEPTPADIRFAKASAQQRLRLTKSREYVLTLSPPSITKESLTTSEATAFFRVSLKTLHQIVNRNRTELTAVGHEAGGGTGGRGRASTFSRRALLHVALIMRQGTSERADVIKRALGAWVGPPAPLVGVSPHELASRAILSTAKELAEEVQDGDPKKVWGHLSAMPRNELQGVAVALAAMLPLDQPGLQRYLTQIGLTWLRDNDMPAHPSRASAAGLAVLVAESATEDRA